jgi:hypothetical protein
MAIASCSVLAYNYRLYPSYAALPGVLDSDLETAHAFYLSPGPGIQSRNCMLTHSTMWLARRGVNRGGSKVCEYTRPAGTVEECVARMHLEAGAPQPLDKVPVD